LDQIAIPGDSSAYWRLWWWGDLGHDRVLTGCDWFLGGGTRPLHQARISLRFWDRIENRQVLKREIISARALREVKYPGLQSVVSHSVERVNRDWYFHRNEVYFVALLAGYFLAGRHEDAGVNCRYFHVIRRTATKTEN